MKLTFFDLPQLKFGRTPETPRINCVYFFCLFRFLVVKYCRLNNRPFRKRNVIATLPEVSFVTNDHYYSSHSFRFLMLNVKAKTRNCVRGRASVGVGGTPGSLSAFAHVSFITTGVYYR